MFEFVQRNKRLTQIVLALIALPFAFFGVDYYFRGGDRPGTMATVAGEPVSSFEFDQALREQQEQARRAMGANFNPAMFESPEMRYAVLEQVVNQRVLAAKARREHFNVSDAQLQQFIAAIPPFQENGRFSPEKYQQLLATQNMTPLMFENRVRQDLTLAPVQEPVAAANIVARPSAERYLHLLEQQREVAVATIGGEAFAKDVKVDEAQVKAFYDQNLAAFNTPEEAKVEYLLLTPDSLSSQVTVDAAEVRKHYDANAAQYAAAEERTAAHILIPVKPDAKDSEKDAARKKAEDILAKARANPAKFGELAKEFSQDSGSAQQGGDLGSFARGTMVKPFEDAAFAAKVGDIIGPVQTDFGFHVIKIDAIRAARTQPFDEVKAQIESDLKRQKGQAKFAAAADQFQNLVYEQADGLAGAAKALNLKVETTPWISRAQAQQIAMGNPKFVTALFAPESIQNKRNTEAIEVAPNTLLAARIMEYKPAAPRPLADVAPEIRRGLVARAAAELAQKTGKERLALLEAGKSDKDTGLTFGPPEMLSRTQPRPGFTPQALQQVFQASSDPLPQYVGAANERGGYSIYKISKVVTPETSDKGRLELAGNRLSEQLGRELFAAYLASLKGKSDVRINQANLEKK
jgi:peptidyl-prolyl cis-trans isomerase D